MYITNRADLKVAYEELLFWKSEPKLNNIHIIRKIKEGIRDYFKRMNQNVSHLVKWDPDGDGEIWMEELPEEINTKEEAEEWFICNKYREATPSVYDCTGQLFTVWYKIFKRNGKYIIYHCICRDV